MQDASYIKIALELAAKGRGIVGAAPLAGVLIVNKEKIISASFNGKESTSNCWLSAIRDSKKEIEGSTLYTNIEPGVKESRLLLDEIKKPVLVELLSDAKIPDWLRKKKY